MSDYISREGLISKFKQLGLGDHSLIEKIFAEGVYAVIDTFPAADVEPVTRCKDCKKSSQTESGKRYCTEPMGAFYGCIPVEDNFFCSGGEGKEETV